MCKKVNYSVHSGEEDNGEELELDHFFPLPPHMPLKIFGKAQKAPSTQDSIRKLQETLELLEKREDYLQKKVDRELVTAKKNATTNRRGEPLPLCFLF